MVIIESGLDQWAKYSLGAGLPSITILDMPSPGNLAGRKQSSRDQLSQDTWHDVFLSHSSGDKETAETVCAALETAGIRCWIAPRDVMAGRPYSGQLSEAIRVARVLLIILTEASNRSKHVLREVHQAAHFGIPVLTFRTEDIEPCDDLGFFISVDHWLNAFPGRPEAYFSALTKQVSALLKRKPGRTSLSHATQNVRFEAGAVVGEGYRLLRELNAGAGGRLFLAQDENAQSGQSSWLGLKLIDEGIASRAGLLGKVQEEVQLITGRPHSNLLRFIGLKKIGSATVILREWVHGFSLFDLLRWRQACRARQLLQIMEALAETIDFTAGLDLKLASLNLHKVFLVCPKSLDRNAFPGWVRDDAGAWKDCSPKLNPLSISPLLAEGAPNQKTITRIRITHAVPGHINRGSRVQLLGELLYELLSGHSLPRRGNEISYSPLPELSESGNTVLRRACVEYSPAGFKNCVAFWTELGATIEPPPARRSNFSDRDDPVEPEDLADQQREVIYEQAEPIADDPNPADTHRASGDVYRRSKNYERAVKAYSEAIRLDSRCAPAYEGRAKVHDELQQYEDAIRDYTTAIRLKPDHWATHYNRGNTYRRFKEYRKAINDYSEVIQLKPNFADAYVNRGIAYHCLRQCDEAINDYNTAIGLAPQDADAYHNRALAYEALDKPAKANADHAKAKELGYKG